MFEGFETRDLETSGARIRFVHGGEGPPLLLLHGNPLTHVSWHKIADRLAERFHVVAADLRGYGDSSAPEPGPDNINFSFRAMAQDQVEVMAALGYDEFMVAGHDRGARTAHRMAQDHPDKIRKAAFLDIVPSHHVWTHTSKGWATSSWHWTFMIQPADFPERMMGAVPADWYMEKKIGKAGIGLAPFTKEAFAEYVRCFDEKTIRGSCADYRACATCDFEMDKADFGKVKVQCPALVLWGTQSHTGKNYDDLMPIWKDYCAGSLTGGPIECGHYVPEHAPDDVLRRFLDFFPD
jgi:haloacetate dehalogenase